MEEISSKEDSQVKRKTSTTTSPRKDSIRTPRSARAPRKESIQKAECVFVGANNHVEETVQHYDSIPTLKIRKHELMQQLNKVDNQIESMSRMKSTLLKFCVSMEEFSNSIFKLSRNNQGVPYVANVKSLIESLYKQFNNTPIQSDITRMNDEDIPFVRDLNVQFRNISKLCESIIVTHVNYHVTFLEDLHMVCGRLRGMMKTLVIMFYNDEDVTSVQDLSASFIIEDQEEVSNADLDITPVDNKREEMDDGVATPTSVPKVLLEDCNERIEPKAQPPIVSELMKLRVIFSNLNERLSEIQRLSLGNPRMQSLRETFTSIDDVLEDTSHLLDYYEENNVPCINNIRSTINKMRQVASVKRPLEKHVELLKLVLGECDGRVLIVSKCLSM